MKKDKTWKKLLNKKDPTDKQIIKLVKKGKLTIGVVHLIDNKLVYMSERKI